MIHVGNTPLVDVKLQNLLISQYVTTEHVILRFLMIVLKATPLQLSGQSL